MNDSQTFVTGKGGAALDLSPDELKEIVREALSAVRENSRVLAIIPDKTRDDNTALLFPAAAAVLAGKPVAR